MVQYEKSDIVHLRFLTYWKPLVFLVDVDSVSSGGKDGPIGESLEICTTGTPTEVEETKMK